MTITPIDHRLLSICPTRTLLGFAKRRARGRAARLMCMSFSSSQGTDPTAVSATSKPMTQTLWKVSIYGKSTIAFRVKVGQLGYRLEAVIGPVKSEQNQMPGNATNQA